MSEISATADTSKSMIQEQQQVAPDTPAVAGSRKLLSRLWPFSRRSACAEDQTEVIAPTEPKLTLRQKLSQLTLSQWFYLMAFIALLLSVDSADVEEPKLVWAAALAGVGLIRELWTVFHLIWVNPVGKGLIVVLYAGTANFALAISALKINSVAGVEPTPFIFTLAFTTLLMLPFWLAVASLLFLSLALIASNLWLLFSVFMRLIGVKLKVHWEDKSFVFVTMILRIILIPILLVSLGNVIEPYFKQLDLFDQEVAGFKMHTLTPEQLEKLENADPENLQQLIDTIKQQQPDALPVAVIPDAAVVSDVANAVNDATTEQESEPEPEQDSPMGIGFLDRLISNFIFYFETYPHSQCRKLVGQRTLVIDENLVFVAQRDDSPQGYAFSVTRCEPNFPEGKQVQP